MRVITGKYRGRVLKGPKHQGLRPTADRVKEALFNIIGPVIVDADFLDLFAGTGGIGIEALSRGAQSVVFVDAKGASIQLLKSNLHFIDPGDQVRVIQALAGKALPMLANEGTGFDIIFLDPPFEAGLLDQTVKAVWELELLRPEGILVAEHPRKLELTQPAGIETQVRHYGDISLSIFKRP
ncbi:MAG TPA: 16S rRNA (guanine(966)-N(2))-methyltransferase RsmD [Bacillota bacterium]|nr:16S rRNA (guanine(966)-N(2))-methyltransferase RsmD [Bacillota bacterium]